MKFILRILLPLFLFVLSPGLAYSAAKCPSKIKAYLHDFIYEEVGALLLDKGITYGGNRDDIKKIRSGYYLEVSKRVAGDSRYGYYYTAIAHLKYKEDRKTPAVMISRTNACLGYQLGMSCYASAINKLNIEELCQ